MTTPIDTKNHPAVKSLAAHQERLGLSGSRFAKRYLRASDATWSQLKSGKYPADNIAPWIEKCETALKLLEDEASDLQPGEGLIELGDQRRAIKLVRACYNEERDRLVLFLADTGGGKTTLATLMREALGDTVVVVEATETWRDNYFAAVVAIASKLGLGEDYKSKRTAEAAVLKHLAGSPRVLVIDEAHSCGPGALNLLKHIINIRTVANRVVLLSMPQLWDALTKKNNENWRQLHNRMCGRLLVDKIGADDCRAFLAARLSGGLDPESGKDVVALCRESANRFGLYNTLSRICAEANLESPNAPVTANLARLAIARVEALRG